MIKQYDGGKSTSRSHTKNKDLRGYLPNIWASGNDFSYFQRQHAAARETSSKSELPTVHTNDPEPGECTEKPLTKLGSRDPDRL